MIAQIEQFQRELTLSSNAKTVLEDRNFLPDTLERFQVGFCPAYAGYDFDLLNGRIVLPIHDTYGNWIGFAGRKVDYYSTTVKDYYQLKTSNLQGLDRFLKWKVTKWVNTPYQKANHLFNLHRAKKSIFEKGYCIIVEGYFDVMRLSQLGFDNVVALSGKSLTETQCELIFRYCNKVLIMLDGDDAGKNATNKTMDRVRQNNIFANVVELPDNLDPDDLDEETMKIINSEITNSDEELYIKL